MQIKGKKLSTINLGIGSPATKRTLRHLYNAKLLLVMLVPAFIYVILFNYLPMTGIVLAFKNYTYQGGIFGSAWSGLNNFKFLIISNKLWMLTRNTLLYNLAFITVGMVLEVGFAIFINELGNRRFKKIFQSFMFLPYFISWVVVVSIVQAVFSYEYGALNSLLDLIGLKRINIYSSGSYWPYLLVLFKAWKQTGYGTVVYLASITGIDQGINEAAEIDGANIWQRIRHITIPSLVPTMFIMFLLGVGQIFRGDFGMFYQLIGNNAQLLGTTDILDLFVYRALSTSNDIGMASAAGLYQSVLCFITIILVNGFIKKIRPDYTLF